MASIFDQARSILNNLGKPNTAKGIGSNKPNFKPYVNTFNKLPQPVKNVAQSAFKGVANTNISTPLSVLPGASNARQLAPLFPTIGQYAQGQIVKPIQTFTNPKIALPQRAMSGVQAGFSLTPGGTAYNIGGGLVAGAVKSARTKTNLAKATKLAIANPSDIAGTGLGIKNPILALGIDVVAGNPRGAISTLSKGKGVVSALRGVNPQAFDLHPDDANELGVIGEKLLRKLPLNKIEADTVERTFARLFPKINLEKTSNKKVQQIIAATLDRYSGIKGAEASSFPRMGIVDDTATSARPILDNKISTTNPEQLLQQSQLQRPLNTAATGSTMQNQTKNSFNSQDYIKELTQKQKSAGSVSGASGLKAKAGSILADLKAKLVDETSPITDVLSSAEKQNKFKVLPKQDIRLQIDRVLRSKTLASQFAEDNGLVDAIKKAPDIDALDQYMIAKQAASVEKQGIKTGRDLTRDQQMINELNPQYEQLAQQVNQYSRNLLDYSVKTGLIDKNLAKGLVEKYPDYVPLNRVFNELEQGSFKGTGKGVASLSKQTVVQKLKGSEREITSPIESLLLKTQDAFSQGERNIAAKQLASYKDLPGFKGLITEVEAGARNPHTFSYIDNGVKRTFATTPEIEAAAKSLNVEQMGLLGKIISVPTRVLQLGATGLNVPFVVTNMVKDEVTGFINSNQAAKTSILNPNNYVKSLFSAIKHDDLYKEMIRNAAGGTSFDIARQAPGLSVSKIRNPIKYTATHPTELLRAVENIIGRSEEFGRIKNFRGSVSGYLKQGRTLEDAKLLGAQAARENTANFARRGSFGRVINWTIPFFNAGVQGARQLTRSFQNNPVATSAKVATTIFTPIAVSTAWNLSDPKRKQIYTDIPAYEKENNIILIPPDPTQDAKGRWNVIKIPLPPGLSNLGTIVRRSMETAEGLDPIKFSEIATNLITAGTSVDVTSGNKLASTFTPQIVKPAVEATTNTNLFTGQKIIPDYLKNAVPEDQTKPGVSPVATGIGKVLNVSPLQVENFAQTQLGGLGSQLLGKESTIGNLERRFRKASGGGLLDKVYEDSDKAASINSQIKKLAEAGKKEEAINLIRSNKDILIKASKVKAIRSQVDTFQEYKNKVRNDSRLTQEQKDKVLKLIQQKLFELSTVYNSVQ